MRGLVKGYVEVFALLVCAGYSAALQRFGEGGGAGSYFTVDDFIVEGLAGLDCAVEEVFADVVDDTSDFSDLGGC